MITIKIQRDGYLPKGSTSAFASRDVHFPYGLFMQHSEEEIEFARDLLRAVDFGEYPCNNNQFFSTLLLWLYFFKPKHFTSITPCLLSYQSWAILGVALMWQSKQSAVSSGLSRCVANSHLTSGKASLRYRRKLPVITKMPSSTKIIVHLPHRNHIALKDLIVSPPREGGAFWQIPR